MTEITKEIIEAEFKKHKLFIIQEFISSSMPTPISNKKYKYMWIKTLEGTPVYVWGASLQNIWDKFQRFLKLRIFI